MPSFSGRALRQVPRRCLPSIILAFGLFTNSSSAALITTFEAFQDSDHLTKQIPGLTFTNVTVVTAGVSLNELEFPPHSGVNAAFDDGGPITIAFANPIREFDAYFDYSVPITLDAFNATSQILASSTSHFSSNLHLSGVPGSTPNEFLQVTSAAGISKITVLGDPNGGSFTMDDISSQPLINASPEPSNLSLLITGSVLFALFRLRRRIQEH